MLLFDNFLKLIIAAGAVTLFIAWLLDRWNPPMSVEAVVVTKRAEVKSKDSNRKVYTVYFETFQPVGGKRREYEVPASAFAVTAVGDQGKLTCRGGRFVAFEAISIETGFQASPKTL